MIYPYLDKILQRLQPGATCIVTNDDYAMIDWQSSLPMPTEAEVAALAPTIKREMDFRWLREDRDKLLAETDWWAVSDRTMTDEERNYRQALRDLPANTTNPAKPVWPTKP